MQEGLRTITIHRALNRPDLIAGCERELILMVGLITVALVVVALNLVAAIAGILLWLVSIVVLRKMAKADPFMSKVYRRHIKYASFYPAKSTPYALPAIHKR